MRRRGTGDPAGRAAGSPAPTGRRDRSVVVVTSPGCAECRRIAPDLDAAAAAHPNVHLERLDAATATEQARSLGVRGTPTIVGYRDGSEVVRSVGRMSRDDLDRLFGELGADDNVTRPSASLTDVKLRAGAGVALVTIGALTGPVWPLVLVGIALAGYGLAGLVRGGPR